MTAADFRKLALAVPGAVEASHMDHPDFRLGGKIFATLGVPDDEWGLVKLTPEQQRVFLAESPDVFKPCSGAWGKAGSTHVHLPSVSPSCVRAALALAKDNVAASKRKKSKRARA